MSRNCCSGISHRIKEIFRENVFELKILLWYTGPLALANFLDYVPIIITTVFVGHIGKVELDAMMLAVSYTTLTGIAVGLGLNAACDTLLSQIYGGRNLKFFGVIMQRAFLILILACFPCWALYINAENILLLCGQNKDVARQAELCVLVLLPELPAFFFFQLGLRFLQNQEVIWPQIAVSCLGILVSTFLNYLLLFVLQIGVIGGAVAITVGTFCDCFLLFIYIRIRKLHLATWPGWSIECLNDWGPFLALAIPGVLINMIECWAFEIAMILAGLINLVELGGQSLLIQLITMLIKIPFALGIATSLRVGYHLGAGETDRAKKSSKLGLVVAGTLAIFIFILLIGLRSQLGKMFVNEKDILSLVYETIPICALFYIFTPSVSVFSGALKGIGKPEIAALAFLFAYCLITFPIGVPLMFLAKLGIKGFWIGMLTAIVSINIYLFIYFWRLDWNLMTEKVKERVGLKMKPVPSLEPNIDAPDNIELTNYASLDCTNKETELQEMADKAAFQKLLRCRGFQALAVVSTLFIGLTVKLTVKLH
ncbi:multidrug and toxin extrusion protein 2-like [Hyla sarda]|uniref:multidrug and toxin extrusion protein 2-like n=1 Tax=Hyla sarda TaxID=327740 RepID=UPI0024C401C3|nr:multidrug and toxin extrusion protein 2-like [Hyla sarda]